MIDRVRLINALISQELLEEACPGHYGLADKCNNDCRQCWSEALEEIIAKSGGD